MGASAKSNTAPACIVLPIQLIDFRMRSKSIPRLSRMLSATPVITFPRTLDSASGTENILPTVTWSRENISRKYMNPQYWRQSSLFLRATLLAMIDCTERI